MMEIAARWYRRYFSDPQGIILAVLLAAGFAVVIFLGGILAPLLAAVVIAYLLEGVIAAFERRGVPRMALVIAAFVLFVALLILLFFGLAPLVTAQIAQLVENLPKMIDKAQQMVMRLTELYPRAVSEDQIKDMIKGLESGAAELGTHVLSFSLKTIAGVIALLLYLVLVPVLVFFLLKDKQRILAWVAALLPRERALAERVWREMDRQIGNYVRGKFAEVVAVGAVAYAVFALMGLQYAMLLAVLVGVSVIVPYIGAVAVTFPVLLIAILQWGLSPQFVYLLLAYTVIHTLDGFVLVPWLFSEAVDLHPVAIIVAILMFGGIWGFWGVFFAIPLAALVKVLITMWPRTEDGERRGAENIDV